jgi:hypothetical protein
MPRYHIRTSTLIAATLSLAIITPGCRKPQYEVASVDGTLTIKGQPGRKVHIEFIPAEGTAGPTSVADTDPDGHFTLHLMTRDGSSPAGAVVGKHKVTLSDKQLSESADGHGIPIRFGPEYTLSSSTPLTQTVKPDAQSIRIDLP